MAPTTEKTDQRPIIQVPDTDRFDMAPTTIHTLDCRYGVRSHNRKSIVVYNEIGILLHNRYICRY